MIIHFPVIFARDKLLFKRLNELRCACGLKGHSWKAPSEVFNVSTLGAVSSKELRVDYYFYIIMFLNLINHLNVNRG